MYEIVNKHIKNLTTQYVDTRKSAYIRCIPFFEYKQLI